MATFQILHRLGLLYNFRGIDHAAGSRLRGARGIMLTAGPFTADLRHLPLQRVQNWYTAFEL